MMQPCTNGHSEVDTAALERLVDQVQAEPKAETVKPKRRARRSKEEIAAEKAQSTISITVDGSSFEGQVDDIARLIKATQKA